MRSEPARSTQTSWREMSAPSVCRSVTWRCTKQCERELRALSRWLADVLVSSTVRAKRTTSAALASCMRVSPTVPNSVDVAAPGETAEAHTDGVALVARGLHLTCVPAGEESDNDDVALFCSVSRLARRAASSAFLAWWHFMQRHAGGCTP